MLEILWYKPGWKQGSLSVTHGETWPLRCLFAQRFCDMLAPGLVVNRVIPSTLTQQQRQYTARVPRLGTAVQGVLPSESVEIALKFCSYREDA